MLSSSWVVRLSKRHHELSSPFKWHIKFKLGCPHFNETRWVVTSFKVTCYSHHPSFKKVYHLHCAILQVTSKVCEFLSLQSISVFCLLFSSQSINVESCSKVLLTSLMFCSMFIKPNLVRQLCLTRISFIDPNQTKGQVLDTKFWSDCFKINTFLSQIQKKNMPFPHLFSNNFKFCNSPTSVFHPFWGFLGFYINPLHSLFLEEDFWGEDQRVPIKFWECFCDFSSWGGGVVSFKLVVSIRCPEPG